MKNKLFVITLLIAPTEAPRSCEKSLFVADAERPDWYLPLDNNVKLNVDLLSKNNFQTLISANINKNQSSN